MSSVNKAIILGNLGNDPDTRYLPNGNAVTNISVATSKQWKDKQTGEQKEKTEWHRISIFGRAAEIAAEYLRKGSKVYIEGELRTRKWQDRDGNDRYTTEIVCDPFGMKLLGSPSGGASRGPARPRQEEDSAPEDGADDSQKGIDFEDDIPF